MNNWSQIKFEKTFEFDYSPDTSELIKDTAISPRTTKWTQAYDRCGFRNHWNQNPPRIEPDETRCVIRYIKGHEGEARESIDAINLRAFDPEESIMIVSRKEQELKKEGRLFVKQTYKSRLTQTSCEKNLHKFVLRYYNHTTMADSEVDKHKKIKIQPKKGIAIRMYAMLITLKEICARLQTVYQKATADKQYDCLKYIISEIGNCPRIDMHQMATV